MPRSASGVKRKAIEKGDIEKAVQLVMEKKLTTYGAAKHFNLSKTTLIRQVKMFQSSGNDTFIYSQNNNVKQVFTEQEELSLVRYIQIAGHLHYGSTSNQIRQLAFKFAQANNKKYDKSWDENQMAGEVWLRTFRKKFHKEIFLRKPESTSLVRDTVFNRTHVSLFFDNYKKSLEKIPQISPSNIWNCGEAGISNVHVPPKIVVTKGLKQVDPLSNAERGVNTTMIAAVNAGGGFIPPMLIFPYVHFQDCMLRGAPSGTIGGASTSGLSNETLFIKFFQHFINHSRATKENSTILLFDNHESHISIPVIQMAIDNGVHLVTLHPQTSHKMQPLDRSIFCYFNNYYNVAMNEWMMAPGNMGKPATIDVLPELVRKAFCMAFTPTNIINGFKITGISPVNENIILDCESITSEVTKRANPNDQAQDFCQPSISAITTPIKSPSSVLSTPIKSHSVLSTPIQSPSVLSTPIQSPSVVKNSQKKSAQRLFAPKIKSFSCFGNTAFPRNMTPGQAQCMIQKCQDGVKQTPVYLGRKKRDAESSNQDSGGDLTSQEKTSEGEIEPNREMQVVGEIGVLVDNDFDYDDMF